MRLPDSEWERNWLEAFAELDSLRLVQANWDGEDADPMNPKLFEPTVTLLHEMKDAGFPAPEGVSLDAVGEILLEWRLTTGGMLLDVTMDRGLNGQQMTNRVRARGGAVWQGQNLQAMDR